MQEAPKTITATAPCSIRSLLSRANAAGFEQTYVRRFILPEWWEDEIATTPAGFAQAAAIIARRTGLDYDSLRSEDKPRLREVPCRFKRTKGTADGDISIARSIGVQLARFTALGATPAVAALPTNGADVRNAILGDVPYVDLAALVEYCWDRGVMVLPLAATALPSSTKKRMHAMATVVDGRPAIIVSHKASASHLLFDVAHELGHIALGHVSDGTVLVDESIDQASDDAEEKAANDYALCVVTGEPIRVGLTPGARWPTAVELARQAKGFGEQHRIDPGHVVLNYGHTMAASGGGNPGAFWGTANAALKALGIDKDGLATLRSSLSHRVDWDQLPEDASEFVQHMLVNP